MSRALQACLRVLHRARDLVHPFVKLLGIGRGQAVDSPAVIPHGVREDLHHKLGGCAQVVGDSSHVDRLPMVARV